MNHVRMYLMRAAEQDGQALGTALAAVVAALAGMPGAQGAMIWQDRADPARFRFIELWSDEAARLAAGPQLPKSLMAAVFAALAGPPESENLVALA